VKGEGAEGEDAKDTDEDSQSGVSTVLDVERGKSRRGSEAGGAGPDVRHDAEDWGLDPASGFECGFALEQLRLKGNFRRARTKTQV
jgi:hypothetical protein